MAELFARDPSKSCECFRPPDPHWFKSFMDFDQAVLQRWARCRPNHVTDGRDGAHARMRLVHDGSRQTDDEAGLDRMRKFAEARFVDGRLRRAGGCLSHSCLAMAVTD